AAVADLFNAKTANLTNDWTLDTGTLDLACNDPTFNGTLNKVANAYDGLGDGTNRWCMTNTGDAVAGEMLSGKKAWVDGIEITGSLATQTLSDLNDTVAAGNYAATTLSAVDTDLATANILSTKTIFGIAGNSNVVNTSTGDAIAGDLFNSKIAWVDGSSVAGTLDLACNDPTFNGTLNKVATAYDGAGDGTNRWCMSDSGNVAVGEMKTGQVAWVDGVAITGTGTQTLSAANSTVNAGYYAATTLETVDADLAAANISSGITIFGVAGSASGAAFQTGQTTSYRTGDDASNDGTAKSYTDPGCGTDTVLDNTSGLCWQKYDQAAKTWNDAIDYCDTLTLGGSSAWRLPTFIEGVTMFDYECAAAGGSCYADFQNSALDWTNTTGSGIMWLSTTRPDSTTIAYYIVTTTCTIGSVAKTTAYTVRCVR
ncbi:MAG: DUF1566 domain-containing protein, partial [bacterium]